MIRERALARLLGVPVSELRAIANRWQLPFSVGTEHGLWIDNDELPAWMVAAKRKVS